MLVPNLGIKLDQYVFSLEQPYDNAFLKIKVHLKELQLAEKTKNIRRALVSLQKIQEKNPYCAWTSEQLEKARLQVQEVENIREAFRYHNFRTKWTRLGDTCSGECFQIVWRKNSHGGIRQLCKEDGTLTQDPEEMRLVATNFYKKLLSYEG